jgi:fatty-acyl-CoA synthase
MSVAHSIGPTEIPLLTETIGARLDATAARSPQREALVDVPSGRRWTYAALSGEVDRLARALLGAGIAQGDRVAIWAPNLPEWVLTQYATAQIGAILVNINPAYRSHELQYVLQQSGTRLLISSESFKTSDYRAMIEEVRPRCPGLERVVYIGTSGWAELVAQAETVPATLLREQKARLGANDPINIQYTSGTTGFPKGALLSHRNILNNGYFVGGLQRFGETDRVCVPVPFYHCFGMVMGTLGAMTHGACVVIPAPSFDPSATLRAVAAERCTVLYGVPTMFIAQLGEPVLKQLDLSSLRTGVMAGSPCPVEVMKRVISELGMREVTICYGMTETSPVSTQTRPDDAIERRVGSVGSVHPHVEICIRDPDTGKTVARAETGEFCTRGYSVMLGYWNMPEQTQAAIDGDGWMRTGDLAVMDEAGYVNIVGRIKDLVIRGGENIYPREVEEFLYTHPDVVDAQVIGVPDPKYGEELMVWLKLRPGAAPLCAESLRAFCTGKLAHYKIPRYVKLVDAFPMTVTGKVRKVEMREIAIAELGLGDVARIQHA